jgi:hypothetical protein
MFIDLKLATRNRQVVTNSRPNLFAIQEIFTDFEFVARTYFGSILMCSTIGTYIYLG